jgi:hypothetical protein
MEFGIGSCSKQVEIASDYAEKKQLTIRQRVKIRKKEGIIMVTWKENITIQTREKNWHMQATHLTSIIIDVMVTHSK